MSRGILRTALTNKTLCLELEYREPSQPEGESSFATGMPRSHRIDFRRVC